MKALERPGQPVSGAHAQLLPSLALAELHRQQYEPNKQLLMRASAGVVFVSQATRWVGSSFWIQLQDDGTPPLVVAAVTEAQAQQAEAQGMVRAKVQFLDLSDRVGVGQGSASETKQGRIVARLGKLKHALESDDLVGATGQVDAWLGECDGGGNSEAGAADDDSGGDGDGGGGPVIPPELLGFGDHGDLWSVMENDNGNVMSLLGVLRATTEAKKKAWGQAYDRKNAELRKIAPMYVVSRLTIKTHATSIVNKQSLYLLAAGLFGGKEKDNAALKDIAVPASVTTAYFGKGGGALKATGSWAAAAQALFDGLGPSPLRPLPDLAPATDGAAAAI